MKLHEYQASDLLDQYQIPTSKSRVIFKKEDAENAFKELANPGCVAKVQVLMGGRGKAGGVKAVKSPAEAAAFASQFLGKPFSTTQSGGESKTVKAVLFAEEVKIKQELYLGAVIDRSAKSPVILFCAEGGVEIEEVAASKPEAIHKIYFSPSSIPAKNAVSEKIKTLFPDTGIPAQIADIALKLAKLFTEKDASICEINPLVMTPEGRVLALDAKVVFDDNALFRHEELKALKDPDEEDARERKAKEFGLSYVSMSGNIGCLVNGAGLAMATMDMIKLAGGEPANFLDVGGGATADQVREAFKIILQDPRVEAILVNIFGGIMKCDVIAEGIIQASKEIQLQTPLIARLEGTNVQRGRELLKNSGLKIHSCQTIDEAAAAAVREAKIFSQKNVHSYK